MLRALFVASVASNALAARVKVEAASSVAHVMDKIGSLLEAHGADAKVLSNLKLFAGQRVTPGATDSFNEILTRVINQIEADVESKIKSGHADTQAEIDRRIGNVKSTTTVVVERKSEADANDKDWSDCVRAEKAARVAVEEAEAALANSRSNINEPCQLQDDRAPYEWTPNPEKLKFVCDISQSGNCDQQLKNYESQIGNMMAGLRSDVDAKVAAYTEAKQACDAAKADAVEKQDSRDAVVTAWEGKRTECEEKHEPRQVAICMFGAALQAKCEGVEAYRTLMAHIDQVKGGEYSHPDRVAEWKTTAMTKCLLSKVVDGAEVNEATLGACEQSVNFDQDVGVLDRKSQLFAELTSPDKFTCAEQTITFTGETWNVPEGDDPASSEYTKEPFHPEVSLAVDSVPFALCRGGNNGGKDTDGQHLLLDGCSKSGDLMTQYGAPRLEDDTVKAGEAICCNAEGQATRNVHNGKSFFNSQLSHQNCTSGEKVNRGEEPTKTFQEAKAVCEGAGLRLCRSQAELETSCHTGCHFDFALAWVDQTTAASGSLAQAALGGRHRRRASGGRRRSNDGPGQPAGGAPGPPGL